jgi:siroheme decarboxylase
MNLSLDTVDTQLLDLLQSHFPLVERPFAALAHKLGVTEQEVLTRVTLLKNGSRKIIRQISAIFDSSTLGYRSTLIGARVDESRLDEAAAIVSRHPGVSHNYRRDHTFNLWYTLAVPPDSRVGLEQTVEILHRQSGAQTTRMLPTLKLFKIGVKFDVTGEADLSSRDEGPAFTEEQRKAACAMALTDDDKRMIRVLQQDLSIDARPFDAWADQAQVNVSELLESAQRFQDEHRMRRFAAVLRHRQAGFGANGMGVWVVPPDQQEEFGRKAASFLAVSHCYLRPTYPDWTYSIFTMVHAPTRPQCDEVLAAIAETTGIEDYAALYSTKEYKKTRVRYFAGDIEAWEEEQLTQTAAMAIGWNELVGSAAGALTGGL